MPIRDGQDANPGPASDVVVTMESSAQPESVRVEMSHNLDLRTLSVATTVVPRAPAVLAVRDLDDGRARRSPGALGSQGAPLASVVRIGLSEASRPVAGDRRIDVSSRPFEAV